MMAAPVVDTPFGVINSDDFYGREGYQVLADYLRSVDGQKGKYCMVGYNLSNTLSEFGSVSRGECKVDENGNLVSMVERLGVQRQADGKVTYKDETGEHEIDENAPVSMNMWGFTPDYFQHSEDYFINFLKEFGQEMKSEFYIPTMVNHLINKGTAKVKVLDTTSKWFGVTYAEDRPDVVAKLQSLVDAGEYPTPLFK